MMLMNEMRFNLLVESCIEKTRKQNFFPLVESCGEGYVDNLNEYFQNLTRDHEPFLEALLEAEGPELQMLMEAIPGMNWLKKISGGAIDKLKDKFANIDVGAQIEKLKKAYNFAKDTDVNRENIKKAYDASKGLMVQKYNDVLQKFGGNHKWAISVLVGAFALWMIPGGTLFSMVWVRMFAALYKKLKARGFKGGPINANDINFNDVVANM